MKRTAIAILTVFFCGILACTSSKKMLEQHHYDSAVAKSTKALMKNPGNKKEINVLAQAYTLANDQDRQRIKFLKQSKEPQVWEEIHERYLRLKNRQNLVQPLPLSVKKRVNDAYVDYDQNIIEAKRKAADYLFSEGTAFLAKNDRYSAREAYDRFTRVKRYLPAYEGIDDKIDAARAQAFSFVLFRIQNKSGKSLSPAFEEDLLKIGLTDQDYQWIAFNTRPAPATKYDFTVVLTIRKIEVSPELSTSSHSEEAKDIEDGWEYVLDANGNVQKDSLGNDMKQTTYKTLRCSVVRFSLGKTATVSATLDFLDNAAGGQMIKSDPVSAQSKFEFVYAVAKGDKEALSDETRKLTALKIAPFPSNEEMILQTAERLKQHTKEIIHANQELLQ
ncbi:MAG: hypothetical protein JW768_13535 [Chitinispirillaceae bacterium]|nr:hypothetical protein [Chitinispirillaceae bacterium]